MRLAVVILLALASASAWSAPAGDRAYAQWRAADRNADGQLSREEAEKLPRLAARFEAIDRNADGRISADEVRAWRRSARSRRAPGRSALEGVFARADTNGDGFLDPREVARNLPRLERNFARIDVDASGTLTLEEVAAWIGRRTRAGGRP